jgi:[protein-PII] uridylyltransferase
MVQASGFIQARQSLLEEHRGPGSGLAFAERYAAMMDEHLAGLFHGALESPRAASGICLAALGGYGRGRLAPHSDVDLLFLIAGASDQARHTPAIEKILYALWDLKLDVGQAVRTPSQCVDMAAEDFPTLTTQLDSRYLVGDAALFKDFLDRLGHWLAGRSRRRKFFKELKALVEGRHRKYGASPYLLEPNVKEGQGGLRDLHAVGWAGVGLFGVKGLEVLTERGFLSQDREAELVEARSFFMDVRLHLHRLVREKTDTLTFDRQVDVAQSLGYGDDGHISGVEAFMRDYYTRVYRTKSTLDYFLARVEQTLIPPKLWRMTEQARRVEKGLSILRGQIELGRRDEIRERPALMMRAFEISAGSGLPLSQRSLEVIRTNLDLVDEAYRTDPQVAGSFLKGLTAIPPASAKAAPNLDAMQVLDFLEAYIPELAGVRAQVQHDAYHVYTVDVHLVVTLWELKKIALGLAGPDSNGFDRQVMERVRDRKTLFLAALLHDIGKGRGRDHAALGAAMVPAVGRRLGLAPESVEALEFLIAGHLYLIEIATRRDLTEEKLIVNCARRIGDDDRLNMLYLLTVADSRATAPEVMNPWKATLLRDLYSKVYRVLTRSDLARKETADRTDRILMEVVKTLEGRLTSTQIDTHLEGMSAHYLSVMTAADVVKHILLERELLEQKKQLIWEVEDKEEGYCEVTVLTQDRPGLLSRMAGIFTLHNINILGAQVFTRGNNVALDIFQVTPPPDRVYAAEAWERVRRDAMKVLTGQLALDYRLARKRPMLHTKPAVAKKPDRVEVDNETSDFYTIVEVYTYDRLGLLYEITQTLFDLQLSINIAKISTKVDQVVDVFYVRDFFGQKVFDDEQIRELKDALLFSLEK